MLRSVHTSVGQGHALRQYLSADKQRHGESLWPAARMSACATLLMLLSVAGLADTAKEEPVGLVLAATGSKLLRAYTETPLDVRPGALLFSGDGIRTAGGPASFLF